MGNQDIDKEESSSSSSESQDTLDEYGFPNEHKKHIENFLFQDDYNPDSERNVADHTDTDIDEQYKSDIDSNDPEIEMEEIAKYKKKKKKKKMGGGFGKKKKKKKKK